LLEQVDHGSFNQLVFIYWNKILISIVKYVVSCRFYSRNYLEPSSDPWQSYLYYSYLHGSVRLYL